MSAVGSSSTPHLFATKLAQAPNFLVSGASQTLAAHPLTASAASRRSFAALRKRAGSAISSRPRRRLMRVIGPRCSDGHRSRQFAGLALEDCDVPSERSRRWPTSSGPAPWAALSVQPFRAKMKAAARPSERVPCLQRRCAQASLQHIQIHACAPARDSLGGIG